MNLPFLTTWYEKYTENNSIDLDSSMQYMFEKVGERDPSYKNFLEKLEKLKTLFSLVRLPDREKRLGLLKYIYYAMRLIDDICDGDTPINIDIEVRREYISQIVKGNIPDDLLWDFLKKIQILSQELGIEQEVKDGMQKIIQSIQFDIERIVDPDKLRNEESLQENFHRMDIDGSINLTSLIFGLNVEMSHELTKELWEASRIWYTLMDFREDMVEWLINIPKEDFQKYKISLKEIEIFKTDWTLSEWMKKWLRVKVCEAHQMLKIYQKKRETFSIDLSYTKNWFLKKLYNYLLKRYVLSSYVHDIKQAKQKTIAMVEGWLRESTHHWL